LTGGVSGSYQYVGATIMCVATSTAPVATAPTVITSPPSGISLGMACSASGFAGTYQYSGVALICVANPVATTPTTIYVAPTTPTTIYVATTTTSTLPPTCPPATPYMWTDGSCRATRQY
jgi:hypothetical protein